MLKSSAPTWGYQGSRVAASFMHPHEFLFYDRVVLRCFSPSPSITSASSDHSSSHLCRHLHSLLFLSPLPLFLLPCLSSLHFFPLRSLSSRLLLAPFSLTSMLPFFPPLPPPCHPPSPPPLLVPLLHLPLSSPAPVHPAVLPLQYASTPQSVSPFIPLSSSHLSIPSPYFCLLFSCEQLSLRGRVRAPSHSLFFFVFVFFFFLFNLFCSQSHLSLFFRFSPTVCAGIKGLDVKHTYTKRSTHTGRYVFVSLVLAPVDTGVFIKW